MRRYTIFFTILLVLMGLNTDIYSGPTVIKDNRVRELAVTPALGRGYSVVTNTFQSLCIMGLSAKGSDSGMKTTPASFDLTYTFEEVNLEKTSKNELSAKIGVEGAYDFFTGTFSAEAKSSATSKETNHHVLGTLRVDSYYASVDEGASLLSTPAQTLLKGNDILGFFQSCGPAYIRSIGRRSTFLVIFTYTSKEGTKNSSFEAQLKAQLKKFGSSPGETNISAETKASFEAALKESKLRITVKSIGLGKSKDASLIATTFDEFHNVIKNGFIATQDEFTGRVTSMEVVPWVENVQFQSLIGLEEATLTDGTKVPRFKMKLNLNDNAEFYMRVLRVGRAKLDTYYKARLCKAYIDTAYREGGDPSNDFKDIYADKVLINQKGAKETVKLEDFAGDNITKDKVDGMYTSYVDFQTKTQACLDKILEKDIRYFTYRDFTAAGKEGKASESERQCEGVEGELAYIPDETIDAYCMPVIADPDKVADEKKKEPAPTP